MNIEDLIQKYENLEGVWNANGAEIARQCFLRDLKQLNEIDTKKVTVPQSVADWIEYCKEHNFTLFGCLDPANGFESLAGETFEGDVRKCIRWCRKESNKFAHAWLDGYEVEKEKRYIVKLKGINSESEYLYYGMGSCTWRFREKNESGYFRKEHTRKELEQAGFGDVFNSPLFEVEEVEE